MLREKTTGFTVPFNISLINTEGPEVWWIFGGSRG